MDIVILQASAYELPTSRRVGVIVHDGATDLRVWPGAGPDKDLSFAYGPPELARILDTERQRAGGALTEGALLRLHPGRLHCDFLVWIASRPPEQAGIQAPAPGKEVLQAAVRAVLEFVSTRNVIRIAFPALGAGPGALPEAERMAIIARACSAYYEDCLANGRPNTIEEVMVCDPRLSAVTAARKLVSHIAKAPPPEKPSPLSPAPAREARTPRASGSNGGRKPAAPAPRKGRLDERDVERARATSRPWDRATSYRIGDWFVHSKFGVGRVEETTTDQFIVVLFEDGETRRLIHAG
jgi:O-acetyl-ADP-ribose deacetylase (regulator of RNase III)